MLPKAAIQRNFLTAMQCDGALQTVRQGLEIPELTNSRHHRSDIQLGWSLKFLTSKRQASFTMSD